jgi:lactate/malate dehydrogenase, NAD binding domain
MEDVAIVGAGELGGNLAHVLAGRDVVRSIRLIDSAGRVATGKALDIMQAAPIERFATQVSGATDVLYAAGAAIIVIADRAGAGEWQGEEALVLLQQLAPVARPAIVLCAGASQRALIERGVGDHRYSAQRLLGSSPEALAGALRALIALETNGSARDIALTVLGIPPEQTVIPWHSVTIAGFAATDVLTEPVRRRIEARLAPLWPPGPHALATAAAEAVSSLVGESRRTLSCFVAPSETGERRYRAAALPVKLGPDGATRMELPELGPRARVALDTAMRL